MPVQIGAKAHPFSDPTGLLSDCHRRIEMFLGALEGVASVIDRPLTKETRAALDSALRHFREAAPKHTADEQESLFRDCVEIAMRMWKPRLKAWNRSNTIISWPHLCTHRWKSWDSATSQREAWIPLASKRSEQWLPVLFPFTSNTSGSRTIWSFLLQSDYCQLLIRLPLQMKWRLDGQ